MECPAVKIDGVTYYKVACIQCRKGTFEVFFNGNEDFLFKCKKCGRVAKLEPKNMIEAADGEFLGVTP